MNEYRQRFDDAIGVGEPSRVDIDGIIAKQRRRIRLRNAALVTSTVAAVVAVGLGAATLPGTVAGGQPATRQSAGSPGSASPVPSPSSWKEIECWRMRETDKSIECEPGTPVPGKPSISHDPALAARMTAAIRAQFGRLGVGWKRTPEPSNPDFKPLEFAWFDPNSEFPGQAFTPADYGASTTTITRHGQGTFFIVVSSWQDQTRVTGGGTLGVPGPGPNGEVLCDTDKPECTRGPSGEYIETSVETGPMGRSTVGVVKGDGTFIYLSSDTTIDKSTSSATQPGLTVAQLRAIALDPAFSIAG